jgi:hypothetical protein
MTKSEAFAIIQQRNAQKLCSIVNAILQRQNIEDIKLHHDVRENGVEDIIQKLSRVHGTKFSEDQSFSKKQFHCKKRRKNRVQ